MTTTITLCPACLTELPDDYPYDHVVIDRVLTTEPARFARMNRRERREVVLTGLTRGASISALSVRLRRAVSHLREVLPADHPESTISARRRRNAERAELGITVRDLWERGLPDTDIALRTGVSVYVIAGIRRCLGLATHPGRHSLFAGGRR